MVLLFAGPARTADDAPPGEGPSADGDDSPASNGRIAGTGLPPKDLPPALGTGAPGRLSAGLCPEGRPYALPVRPTLALPGDSGGAVYGRSYGENYGAGPGSTIDHSSAVLGRDCPPMLGH